MFANRPSSRLVPAVLGVALLGFVASVQAAVPVEESVAEPPRDGYQSPGLAQQQSATDSPGAASGDPGGLAGLFYQLQVLQREVRDLRGMLEEQGHRLDRLERDQQEQYLDLDRRMQALRSGGGSEPGPSALPESPQTEEPAFTGATPASEREAYTQAFELMKQRQFDASAQAFNRLVIDYPNGAYTPNAFYWLGELYLAQEDNERARQSFAQVVNLYPDHQKVPDALYKLGVVYHRLGDVERAREYLNRVRTEHPASSAAGLAQTYLAEL